MVSPEQLGRMPASQIAKGVSHDAPEAQVAAIMTKLDECISRLNAIAVAIEVATDAPSLFAQLDVAAIKAEIKKISLKL
jgi:hypothetical protein